MVLRTPRRLGDFEPAGLLASLLHDGGRATRWASALAEKAAPNAGFRGTPAQHLVHQEPPASTSANAALARWEYDFQRELAIPEQAYWGVHSVRAIDNVSISGQTVASMHNC